MTVTPPPRYSTAKINEIPPGGDSRQRGDSPTTINVLILGETANGKSTLVRQLGIYGGNPNPNVMIGYGETCWSDARLRAQSTDDR